MDREAAVARERREAERLLSELEEQAATRRLLLILNSRRYCNWFLCEELIERAFQEGLRDPESSAAQAEVATALAGRLLEVKGDGPVVRDLLGRAWAVLGNSRRLLSDLSGADEALARAEAELDKGSGDPLEEVRLARFLGTLRLDQRRFEESLRCYDRSIRCARAVGDDHLVGRALLDRANTHGEAGRHDKRIDELRKAVRLIDGDRDPRLLLIAQHNLARSNEDLQLRLERLSTGLRINRGADGPA